MAVGDPHMTTYDGQSYDYNGIGEYWLVKSSTLHVQVRIVQAKDTKGNPVSASVFEAVSVQAPHGLNQNMSDRIHLEVSSDSSKHCKSKCNSFILKQCIFCYLRQTDGLFCQL